MITRTLKVTPGAAKFLESIKDLSVKDALLECMGTLNKSYLPDGRRIRKIEGMKPPLFRLRCEVYRILFRRTENFVVVMVILHRKDLEKELKKLRRAWRVKFR